MRVATAVLAGALALAMAGCGSSTARPQAGKTQPESIQASVPAPAAPAKGLPRGWRWESFAGVEIGVPGSWGYGTTGSPWCLPGNDRSTPYVGRPGPVAAIGCTGKGKDGVDPGTKVTTGGTFVWFRAGSKVVKAPAKTTEGDRDTRTLDKVTVDVQAPAALRRQIWSTVRPIAVDENGCAVTVPLGQHLAWRPAAGTPVGELSGVSAVSACRYHGPLFSSVRLKGTAAATAIAALAAAPEGGGPNAPSTCLPSYAYGDEAVLLRIDSARGETEVVLRYSGCDHHGFDDGATVRTLTAAAVAPFLVGPNAVTDFSDNLGSVIPHP